MANAVAEAIPLRVVLMPLPLPSLMGGEEEEAMVFIEAVSYRSPPPTGSTGPPLALAVDVGALSRHFFPDISVVHGQLSVRRPVTLSLSVDDVTSDLRW